MTAVPSAPNCDGGGDAGDAGGDGTGHGGGGADRPAPAALDDTALSLVVNALADLHADDRGTLADDASADAVRDAYHDATDEATRAAFEDALAARFEHVEEAAGDAGSGGPDEGGDGDLLAVVRAVAAELDARDASFVVRHDVPASFSPLAVGLNRYARTRDAEALLALDVSPAVRRRFEAAAKPLQDERYDAVAWALEDAVGSGSTHADAVASRVAAGWARHWAGDHDAALDLVEETLHLDTSSWPARQLALAVRHDSPEFFRDGRLAAAVYLRARVTEPDGTTVTASLGTQTGSGTDWHDLPGPLTCVPIESLPSDGTLRFELTGTPRAMPTLQTYYVALGVVEPKSHRARSADHVLLDGPNPAAVETVRVETAWE